MRKMALLVTGLAIAAETTPQPFPSREEHFRIVFEPLHLKLFLRHLPRSTWGPGTHKPPVLFIHGSTLPSGASAAFRVNGISWMDDLAARGFDVWALDFLGYGGADRYPEMSEDPGKHPPLGRAPEAARQIAAAVDFITATRKAKSVQIVAHSGGSIPAGLYATMFPERVDRLVLFGPVVARSGERDTARLGAYALVTGEDQITRFSGWVPNGETPVFDKKDLATLALMYVESDPTSRSRSPASVRAPLGRDADAAAAWSGNQGYDPSRIVAPVLIIRGEWDPITTDADARRLFDALRAAPYRLDIKISRATHVMQFEAARGRLYTEVANFLAAQP